MKNSERKNNEILEKIESEKEILKTLPQNNKKILQNIWKN